MTAPGSPDGNIATPYRIGLLLIDGFALMSYAAVVEPLRAANLLSADTVFTVDHVTPDGTGATSSSGAVVQATAGAHVNFDLVLAIAGGDPASFRDETVLQWLRRLDRAGVTLGGVSGGPVILAAAGVMARRRMTVHWEHMPALAELAPDLFVERNIYVVDRDRMTCAGGIAPLDLMHALIGERRGPRLARLVSDWFMHTEVRPAGSQQRAGLVERYGVTDETMVAVIEAMENRIGDPLPLNRLAEIGGVGARQINRLFRDKLGQSTMAFYRDIRLAKARSLLTGSPLSVTEIALATGFASSAHFASVYKARFGEPPSACRTARATA